MRIINICMFIFFAVRNIAGSAEQNSLRVITAPEFAYGITMKFQKVLNAISNKNPSLSDKCHQFRSKDLQVFYGGLHEFLFFGENIVKVVSSQAVTQAAFEDLKESWLNFPEDELQRLLEKVLESGFDQEATIGFLSDNMLKLIESQNLLLDAADQINQEEEKKRNLIEIIGQELHEKHYQDYCLNRVCLEETNKRAVLQNKNFSELSDILSDKKFKDFKTQITFEKFIDQCSQSLLNKEKLERLKMIEDFKKLMLEKKFESTIHDIKEISSQFEMQFNKFYELCERKIISSLEKELADKKLKDFRKMQLNNALHFKKLLEKKAERDPAEKALQNDHRKKFQKSSAEWRSMMSGFYAELNQFDQEFDQWQKAIVLVQRFLQQKIIDQQKKECAQSFQEWTSSARKHLHEYQTCLKSFLDEHQNDVLKLMADNQAQKSNKIFTASLFQRLLTFAQEQKNKRLLQQQQPEQLPQIRQNNPYGEPFDNQEYNQVNASVVNSKYFYWRGVLYAQDDQGYQYFWDTSLQKWKLVTDAQDNLTLQTEEEELQQARANGWPISTIEELKRIHELNKKVQEANQKMAEKRERIAQGLQNPPPRFVNFQ